MRAKWSIYLLLLFNATLMGLMVISDFYSLFTDEFYVLKKENYLTLLVALPYWLYLVVVGLKIQQEENTDPAMRNLEYLVYFALAGGLWQVWTVYRDWSQYAELQQHYILPESFYPMGIAILSTFTLLYLFSMYTFNVRKRHIGPYRRDQWEESFEAWEEFRLGQEGEVPLDQVD
jgi:hypothetical protein